MLVSLKAAVVVLTIAAVIFRLAKPLALQFSAEEDYARRRKIWLVLTGVAFISPSFWLYALVAVPLLIWGSKRDANPIAFYLLLLQVVPQILIAIPTVGIGSLLDLDMFRLLAFCVLMPAIRRQKKMQDSSMMRGFTALDFLIIAWGILELCLFVPTDLPGQPLQESITGLMRRAVAFYVDIWTVYYAASRLCTSRKLIAEALAAFCLSCVIMAPLAVFENLRHWLLYAEIYPQWSGHGWQDIYLFRGGVLRAQVSAGHSIALGFLLAVGFGCWLYLQSYAKTLGVRLGVAALLWFGLIATYSRGPWMGAAAVYFVFSALGPRALPRLVKSLAIAAIAIAAIGASPMGERIISVIPFMGGSVDSGSITYRQMLAARSWELISESPFFGDQHAYFKMKDLRQGEGIIDLVNTYAAIALFYGFVGLTLFAGFMLLALLKTQLLSRRSARADPDLARLGTALSACMTGAMVMLTACSFILALEKIYYVLGGLGAAYAYLGRLPAGQRAAELSAAKPAEPA